jgi:hypothetical protein
MEEGFVLDRIQSASSKQQTWVEGEPEPSFWTGLKVKGRRRFGVTAFRCPNCGVLVQYAR